MKARTALLLVAILCLSLLLTGAVAAGSAHRLTR